MIKIYIKLSKKEILLSLLIVILIFGAYRIYRTNFIETNLALSDNLSGNIFPSMILSLATTEEQIIEPLSYPYVGNPKNNLAVILKAPQKNTYVSIDIAETPFSHHSHSTFILPKRWETYTIYPEIVWNFSALRNNTQPTPVSFVITITISNKETLQKVYTLSMRSINECLTGYYKLKDGKRTSFIPTPILFAAYVNEDNPAIDKILREALNTRLVNRFLGYQKDSLTVIKQVYALWNVLQRRHFQYSSISNSSLGSNIVYAQRVRTFEDALNASQINCVDGSAIFASLLRAINIDPIFVHIPGHMYIGFYTDKKHQHKQFLETTMIGNVNLDDYFPDEHLDSTLVGKTQNEMSKITFDKSLEYANAQFTRDSIYFLQKKKGYMFLEISDAVRNKIQPIGK